MTRDEKTILVRMLGGGRGLEFGGRTDLKRALSRLIASGYVTAKRTKTHPAYGHNQIDLTPKGLAAAARFARRLPRQYRRSDWWNPRPSKIAWRTDAYGYLVLS
jgi:hypothetical protein